jgi:hypothetical protein
LQNPVFQRAIAAKALKIETSSGRCRMIGCQVAFSSANMSSVPGGGE